MAKNYRFVLCMGCNRFKFTDGDPVWREFPAHSEHLSKVVINLSKSDLCQNCQQQLKRETKVCKQHD